MREKIKDFENPERVWKDLYHNELCDLEEERLSQSFPIAHTLKWIPKYSIFAGLIFLIVGAMACFAVAYIIASNKSECGFWSSVLLNLGMGLISGIVIWCFTERRSRIERGYETIAKIMRKRLETLQVTLHEHLANPLFVLFNMRNRELACEWLRMHHNFILTIQSHFKYWDKILKGKIELGFGKLFKIIDEKLSDSDLGSDVNILKKSDEELRILCGNVSRLEMNILKSYENRIEILESNVLDVRFGRRPFTLRRKGMGGKINDQIQFDIAMENLK